VGENSIFNGVRDDIELKLAAFNFVDCQTGAIYANRTLMRDVFGELIGCAQPKSFGASVFMTTDHRANAVDVATDDMATEAVTAAPAGLAATVTGAALASAAAASTGATALATAARQLVWAKLRLVLGCGAAAVAGLVLLKLLLLGPAPGRTQQASAAQTGSPPSEPIAVPTPDALGTLASQSNGPASLKLAPVYELA